MRIIRAALLLVVSVCPAAAQGVSEFVIPGRPDVPLLINGVDVSWAVVEGDLGLNRPGQVTPTVIYRLPPVVIPYSPAAYGPGYFPRNGERPGYGRLEVVPGPNRRLPPPAPSFRQSWSSSSAPGPVTIYPPSMAPPVVAPVVVTPGGGPPWHRPRGRAPQAPPGIGNE